MIKSPEFTLTPVILPPPYSVYGDPALCVIPICYFPIATEGMKMDFNITSCNPLELPVLLLMFIVAIYLSTSPFSQGGTGENLTVVAIYRLTVRISYSFPNPT